MTIALLTLVALWCGNPTTHSVSYKIGPNISIEDVNQCRDAAIKCLENPDRSQATQTQNDNATRCFKQIKYPGKDN